MRRGVILAVSLLAASTAAGLELREDPYRVGVFEVGDPVLLTYEQLTEEMGFNEELKDYVQVYGWPDYAETQRIEMHEPFYPYEVRLYYLDGNRYIVFGRVNVAPTVRDFGTRKYIGNLDAAQVQRLLTAQPMVDPVDTAAYQPASSGPVEWETAPATTREVAAAPAEVEIVAEPATKVEALPAAAADEELRQPAAAAPAAAN